VVVGYNAPAALRRTLEALRRHARPAQLIVVDNGSTVDLTGVYADYEVEVLRLPEMLSYAAALNRGLEAARHAYVLCLHNDVYLMCDPQPAVEYLAQAPHIGIIGARLLYRDGRVQHVGINLHRHNRYPVHIGRGRYAVVNYPIAVPAASSACWILRKTALRCDEAYWYCYEDVDLCLQYRGTGYHVALLPEFWGVHDEGTTLSQRRRDPDWIRRELQSQVYFQEKWCHDLPLSMLGQGGRPRGLRGLVGRPRAPKVVYINVGSGDHPLPGFINVDIRSAPELNYRVDACNLFFCLPGTADYIYAGHLLPYLDDDRAALAYWYSLLKPGGRLGVVVTDAGVPRAAEPPARSLRGMKQPQTAPEDRPRRTYTAASLRELLQACLPDALIEPIDLATYPFLKDRNASQTGYVVTRPPVSVDQAAPAGESPAA